MLFTGQGRGRSHTRCGMATDDDAELGEADRKDRTDFSLIDYRLRKSDACRGVFPCARLCYEQNDVATRVGCLVHHFVGARGRIPRMRVFCFGSWFNQSPIPDTILSTRCAGGSFAHEQWEEGGHRARIATSFCMQQGYAACRCGRQPRASAARDARHCARVSNAFCSRRRAVN